jgi:hypothetical protein
MNWSRQGSGEQKCGGRQDEDEVKEKRTEVEKVQVKTDTKDRATQAQNEQTRLKCTEPEQLP